MSRAASLNKPDDATTTRRRRRAARLLPLVFALLFATAASQQPKEPSPAGQLPPRLAVNQRDKQTEQTKPTDGGTKPQPPTCPNITVRCAPKIDAGRPAAFTAYLKRTGPGARR
ncbi:MAG TPA: hypothetical protein VF754_01575, partial [Pyrinomonadaceae bacterium]